MQILEMQKNIQKIFLVLVIIVFELATRAYLYFQENLCDRQSTCYQTVLRSQISQRFSKTGAFWHSSNHIFCSHQFPKYFRYEADLFFQNTQNFMQILEMQKKIEETFSVLVIMVFEPVAGTYFYHEENSCDQQSTCYQTVLTSEI